MIETAAPPPSVRAGFEALDPCVHCGFCLPACPTYLATGDEADGPRGRIMLMRALERGELSADDPALVEHLDACLGCRGCEPVCPSGVGYGHGLEAARERLASANGLSPLARLLLGTFARPRWGRVFLAAARTLRATGLPARLAGNGRVRFGLGMLAATQPLRPPGGQRYGRERTARPSGRPTARVALFRGCVMDGLFRHVHEATRRTLEANGYEVIEVPRASCCGALHAHAGARGGARELAVRNLAAFEEGFDAIAVNSAGCGAILRDYGHLLGTAAAERFGARVRDVTELLAAAGPRTPDAPLDLDVAYDPPCHLQHAQQVHQAPLAVLAAVPGLRVQVLPGADRCCGGAGLYTLLRPAMAQAVLADKLAAVDAARPRPSLIVTGNPGCLMQIGAGLRARRLPIGVAHPVELLDRAYGSY